MSRRFNARPTACCSAADAKVHQLVRPSFHLKKKTFKAAHSNAINNHTKSHSRTYFAFKTPFKVYSKAKIHHKKHEARFCPFNGGPKKPLNLPRVISIIEKARNCSSPTISPPPASPPVPAPASPPVPTPVSVSLVPMAVLSPAISGEELNVILGVKRADVALDEAHRSLKNLGIKVVHLLFLGGRYQLFVRCTWPVLVALRKTAGWLDYSTLDGDVNEL